ncbi:hypothetical protein [Deefgea rivuli]|uniref:hypothetical protein n=1 Tax=Deefgea rivuli TaxID=400948 RepID=UPI0012EB2DF9|nr:hypothetical protein [Deefgea rivuli]
MNSIPSSMIKIIYRKTSAGEREIIARQMGLSAKLRRALILIDGVKTVGLLSGLVLGMELLPAINELESLGLIQSQQNNQLQQAKPLITSLVLEAASPQPVKPSLDAERLNAIKDLMIASSETLLGIFSKTLVEKIKVIEREEQLGNAISQWNISMRESKKGQQHAEQYLEAIRTLMK